jgi:glycosyltransferase involved in cell wall biosynthesis
LPKIIFTVTNDLSYDQRMQRIAGSLAAAGYEVLLVGRKLSSSIELKDQSFGQKRLSCIFNTGFLFYAEYNLRLLLFLLAQKAGIVCAIDLDTILAVYISTAIKKQQRVYDAHELFTEQIEIISRPAVHRFWRLIEKFAVPRFPKGYTVNRQIAKEFLNRYGVVYEVVRNLPLCRSQAVADQSREKFILYQGAVNEGRCFETLIPAMKAVNARLYICGTGNFLEQAKELSKAHQLEAKIIFRGNVEPTELARFTPTAYIGLTLFESTGMNQYYSLSNRFFDYIMAGLPQLCMHYPEYANINNQYKVAYMIGDAEQAAIAHALNYLLEDEALHGELKTNCLLARQELNWEKEEQVLLEFYKKL